MRELLIYSFDMQNILYFLIIFLPILNILYYSVLPQIAVGFKNKKHLKFLFSWKQQNINFLYNVYFVSVPIYFLIFLLVIYLNFKNLYFLTTIDIFLYSWIITDRMSLDIGFLFDSLTLIMLLVVIIVSLIVHIYSIDYMLKDPHLYRFLAYLSFFTFFMIILVTANNFLQLFVGWEGVGLCSYLLINFWYHRISANKASLKAIIVNRIGDCGLIFAAALLYFNFRTLKYSVIFSLIPYFTNKYIIFFSYEVNYLTFLCFFLFLAAVGKSAQIGLHTWLPDAMEGPTPVSALIHAATMVTAGVFLIIRCSVIFEYTDYILILMVFIGSLTTFLGATVGLFQYDIKKVIAYSTCSQLGYMVFSAGLSGYISTFFHLTNHAFFKALLFLAAGLIIHSFSNEQDMRFYGNFRKILPLVYVFILIGSLSLCGFPFYAGWYSKDVIIEVSFLNNYILPARFCYLLGSLATFFTAFYSFRLLYLTFYNGVNSSKNIFKMFHEPNKFVLVLLIFLVFASVLSGYVLQNVFNLFFSSIFSNSISIIPKHNYNFEFEFLPVFIKLIPLFYTIIAFVCTWYFFHYYYRTKLTRFENLDLSYKIFMLKRNFIVTFNEVFIFSVIENNISNCYKFFYVNKFYSYKILIISLFSTLYYLFFFLIKSFFFFLKNFFIIFLIFLDRLYLYILIFFNRKWFFDNIFNFFVNNFILRLSYDIFFKLLDKGLLEILGPKGVYLFIVNFSKKVEFFHLGSLISLLTYFFYGILCLFLIVFYFF